MLQVSDLSVAIGDKTILHDINLAIEPGEVHVLFGPNGSGKSTLLGALMGFARYRVLKGSIRLKGEEMVGLPVHERARRGIGLAFQRPPTIRGLTMRQMLAICAGDGVNAEELAACLRFERFLDREVNAGFSGGELKRSELMQLMAQSPDLVLLDEPESGVDLENIALIGRAINYLLGRRVGAPAGKSPRQVRQECVKAGLIITHTGYILDYVNADVGHVLYEGRISCSGNPRELLRCIHELGYGACVRCTF